MLEHWEEGPELYGTSVDELQAQRANKKLAFFDVDVRRAARLKEAVPTAFLALVAPESLPGYGERFRKALEAAAGPEADAAALDAQVAERVVRAPGTRVLLRAIVVS